MMAVLETVQFREEFSSPSLPEIASEDTEDVEELKGQLKALQERLKKATDAAHTQDQRARKAEAALTAEREKMAAERAELAGLREVVFTADHRDDDHISVSLPYEVKQRAVIFGGHDMWQKPMKEFLTVTYKKNVEDRMPESYEEIRNDKEVGGLFGDLLPSLYPGPNMDDTSVMYKNLYILGGKIAVTPRSLRKLFNKFDFF
jgi:DNA repair exonuclease SbcCD ATPase subunit